MQEEEKLWSQEMKEINVKAAEIEKELSKRNRFCKLAVRFRKKVKKKRKKNTFYKRQLFTKMFGIL